MHQGSEGVMESAAPIGQKTRFWQRVLPWLITAGCFVYLYSRLERAAEAQGSDLFAYLAGVFEHVSWSRWLALMVPYSIFFFLLDTLVVWRVVNWFNAKLDYKDIIPIRASSYILSIVNEQVSKGAMALYLKRRAGVPGWEVGSSMVFIMFCEFSSLLIWATVGVFLQWDRFPKVFHLIPWIAVASLGLFTVIHLFFSGRIWPGNALRERPIFSTFRRAKLWHYGLIIALRAPLMLSAVLVYTLALRLFGVSARFIEMLGYLAVIFFGASTPGPMRSVAILLWVILFPARPAEMATFGFVQHNFFILFNAAIGLLFLRRATRELSLASKSVLLAVVAGLMLQWSAGISWAQLSTPNKSGVTMGHVHYHVRDVEAHKRFWVALGAKPIRFNSTDVMKFPDILIFLTRAAADGSTEGSVVSHVAFKVADLGPVLAALQNAAQKVPPRQAQSQDLNAVMVQTPDGDAVEMFNGNREIVRFVPDPGHGDPATHRHNKPMSVAIATHHIHIYVPEGADEKARDWYVGMFGAIPGIRFRYKAADLPGMTMNFLGQPAVRAPTKGRTLDHIGFEVKGLEAFCRALEGKGVKFDVPFTKGRDGVGSAFLTDPWGTYIELTEGLSAL